MLKQRTKIAIIASLILCLVVPAYLTIVSSSSGSIKINTTGTSTPGQQVQTGGNVNLYMGGVTWNGANFSLFMNQDSSTQLDSGLIYTPRIDVYDVGRTTATTTYTGEYGTWTVGNNWVNGTVPAIQGPGNYYIKAVDSGSAVAVTDTYLTVASVIYNSTLSISPTSGAGGTPLTFTGSGWPSLSIVDIYYNDPSYGWRYLSSTTANSQGQISYNCEAPDLQRSSSSYYYYEPYSMLSFKAQTPSSLIYSGTVSFTEYHRGLTTVGNATGGLYGNSTDLTAIVRVREGDTLTVAGKWFHSGSPIYIKWDSAEVVGTVTGDQWASNSPMTPGGTTAANVNGSFSTTVTIPTAEAGSHYLSVEDSQSRVIVKISVCKGTLDISPSSGPGGATINLTGSLYPESTNVDLYYYDTVSQTWKYWTSTTSTAVGTIAFSTEAPDLHIQTYAGQYSLYSQTLSLKTKVNGVAYAYVDYYQYGRGLTQVGSYTPYELYGNSTDLSNNVNLRPGDSLSIKGAYFHPGIVYVRFDGKSPTGQSYVASKWGSSIDVGSTTANQNGTFEINVVVPTVYDGVHSIAIEDSESSLIVNIYVTGEKEPSPTAKPTNSPTTSPTNNPSPTNSPSPNLPTPTIDLTCKGSTTSSRLQAEISGQLLLNGQAVSGSPVQLSYSKTGGNSWESLTLVNTASDGTFSAIWMPDATGNYLIKATSEANSNMNSASKTVNLVLDTVASNTIFTVNSNSTITEFAFNSTSQQLSFLASGPDHTTGYVEIYIPKSLVNDISQLSAYKDGQQITFSSRSQGDSWIITFNYSHSQHLIILAIEGNVEVPGTDNSQMLFYILPVAVIAAVAIAAVALLNRRSKSAGKA